MGGGAGGVLAFFCGKVWGPKRRLAVCAPRD
jgi:hypothetical protein